MKLKMTTKLFFSLLIGSLVFGLIPAGTLDPPGPPAPTMVTLQQIYDRLGGGLSGVARTGQTGCWDASGTPISCAGTGQDGELQKGVSTFPRFTDNANGTVKDNLTGLIWLKNANCSGLLSWTNALSTANTLSAGFCGLTDGSVAGAWRLPNVKELQSLIDFQNVSPALPAGHPFAGVQSSNYWSSTTVVGSLNAAWEMNINDGTPGGVFKSTPIFVWPVRGGQ